MTLALLLVDEHGVPTAAGAATTAATFSPAVHHKVGVRQADVPSHGGGPGLAMFGWLRGLRFG